MLMRHSFALKRSSLVWLHLGALFYLSQTTPALGASLVDVIVYTMIKHS